MGALAAAMSKNGGNVIPQLVIMLNELSHRGGEAYGIATSKRNVKRKSIDALAIENLESNIAVGHTMAQLLKRDHPQPLQGNDFALVFEGRLFPLSGLSEANEVLKKLKSDPSGNASYLVKELEGSFVFAIACQSKLIVGRDLFGTNPLYYGENETAYAVASERKALWALGMKNMVSFPPGNLALITSQGFQFKSIKSIPSTTLKKVEIETAARHLQDLLVKSIEKRISDLDRVAVAFSGGIDSSVIAVLARNSGIKVQLVSVGLQRQPELKFAEKAAKELDLDLFLRIYGKKDVERILPTVLWLIEESNVVSTSIAIPFYWVAENASRIGHNVLLSGQGGDELFGGYHKYLPLYARFGVNGLKRAFHHDMATSYKTNFQRDNQVCSFHKVELRHPFVDGEVVGYSLGLHPNIKIASPVDILRKRVLRKVAHNLDLPSFITRKVKKAIQYSTGVNKAIQKLAREERLSTRNYIDQIYRRQVSISKRKYCDEKDGHHFFTKVP